MAEAHAGQTVTHVEAGSEGKIIRVLMDVARKQPEWRAVGRLERYTQPGTSKTVYRQRLERNAPQGGDTD